MLAAACSVMNIWDFFQKRSFGGEVESFELFVSLNHVTLCDNRAIHLRWVTRMMMTCWYNEYDNLHEIYNYKSIAILFNEH